MLKLLFGIILFFLLLLLLAGAAGIGLLRTLFGGIKSPPRQPNETNRPYSNPDKDKIFGDKKWSDFKISDFKDLTQKLDFDTTLRSERL